MDRLLNYIFLLIVVYVFALWAPAATRSALLVGLIISFLFCSIIFILGWLTLDGAASAMVLGTIAFGIGGWPITIILISFFLSSALITRKKPDTEDGTQKELSLARRNGLQVWANGFWMAVWLLAGILTGFFVCWMAAAAAIVTATADTWATELGSQRFKSTTYLLSTGQAVEAGTEGGVSKPGMAAAFGGSLFISIITAFIFGISVGWVFTLLVAGLFGVFFDSYAGAAWQRPGKSIKLPKIGQRPKQIIINNNMVNWLATGAGSIMLFILNILFI